MPREKTITGRVVDAAGVGIPGVLVQADPIELEDQGLTSDEAVSSTRTNPDGTFRLGGLGDFDVAVEARRPVVWWRGSDKEWIETRADRRGRFEVGPFPAEGGKLRASPPESEGRFWQDQVIEVKRGDAELRVELQPYGDLEIRTLGRSGSGYWGDCLLAAEGPRSGHEWQSVRHAHPVFKGLPLDRTYSFFMEPDEEGRVVFVKGLRPGPDPVEVRLRPGGIIRGRATLPPETKSVWLRVSGPGFTYLVDVERDGSFEILGIPPGVTEVKVKLTIDSPEDPPSVSQKARVGEVLEFK